MAYFSWTLLVLCVLTQSGDSYKCGEWRQCECIRSRGLIMCTYKKLIGYPRFVTTSGFHRLSLRHNNIRQLPTSVYARKFHHIDLRNNPLQCSQVPSPYMVQIITQDSCNFASDSVSVSGALPTTTSDTVSAVHVHGTLSTTTSDTVTSVDVHGTPDVVFNVTTTSVVPVSTPLTDEFIVDHQHVVQETAYRKTKVSEGVPIIPMNTPNVDRTETPILSMALTSSGAVALCVCIATLTGVYIKCRYMRAQRLLGNASNNAQSPIMPSTSQGAGGGAVSDNSDRAKQVSVIMSNSVEAVDNVYEKLSITSSETSFQDWVPDNMDDKPLDIDSHADAAIVIIGTTDFPQMAEEPMEIDSDVDAAIAIISNSDVPKVFKKKKRPQEPPPSPPMKVRKSEQVLLPETIKGKRQQKSNDATCTETKKKKGE